MDADTLHALVSSAIWRAEQLEEHGVASASLAWGEVSQLEEALATIHPPSNPEGRIARRGAVGAALKAGDFERAEILTQRFLAEKKVPRALRADLRRILDEFAASIASRFRYAAKRHRVSDARDLASFLRRGGPFGLAAAA